MVLTRLSRTKPCLTRCMEVFNYEISIRSENGGEPSSMQGAIRFEHVSFSYRVRSVPFLEDICISVDRRVYCRCGADRRGNHIC
ncbi:MAG: hypothetical protein ACLSBB_16260 [Ruthenibacterium lactatiformans]